MVQNLQDLVPNKKTNNMKTKNLIQVTFILLIVLIFSSCEIRTFNKEEYRGYIYVKLQDSTWSNFKTVVLSSENEIRVINVPVGFTDVYDVGDTIK